MAYRRQYFGDFDRARRDHPDWPVIVSEGDSWFSYSDVVGRLDDPEDRGPGHQRPWALLRLEDAGDEILAILSGAQRAFLRDRVFQRTSIDALLFSAGGNDIIGPDLPPLLREYREGMEARDLVQFSRFERRLRQIQDCYRELLDLLLDAGQETKVLVNSYDYVMPSDRPAKLLGVVKISGPWLLPAFEARGIPRQLFGPVVELLIDGFVSAVQAVAAEPRGFGRLILVDVRGHLRDAWKDEIHPNRKGAKIVAAEYAAALQAAGIG